MCVLSQFYEIMCLGVFVLLMEVGLMNITATVGKSTDIKHNSCNEHKNRMAETRRERLQSTGFILHFILSV